MKKLHPTLWRTCRILSGPTRLALLRAVISSPAQSVGGLAAQLHLSIPRASQELRRLQSRGLIQASRRGMNVLYRPVPDRLVSTAPPLLQAMQEAFLHFAPTEDGQTVQIATAFSHARRLLIIRLLLFGPARTRVLEEMSGMSRDALNRHLRKLRDAGLIRREGRKIQLVEPSHPLARSLLEILKDSPAIPA